MSANANFIIKTKGTQGMSKIGPEFLANVTKVASVKPLDEYAAYVSSAMQDDAPVLTGYLRNNIRSWRENPTTVHVTAWAPYSEIAEYRSRRPHYFQKNALPTAHIGGHMIGDASFLYFKTLLNKYQNRP